MLLSKSCRYALRAMIFVASQEPNGRPYLPINRVSDALNIPFHFLTKVLQQLTHDGLLVSIRGPAGGVALSRPAEEISVADIVVSIEGPALFHACVLGLEGCGNRIPCPLHDYWVEERERMRIDFETTSLRNLSENQDRIKHRLMDPEDPDANLDPDRVVGRKAKARAKPASAAS
ncbi:MAG: Rrf2 family transcriptional regulator [Planctomycetes bacterium]|nr:Rrf2 family transcriptional regulator [Planctomycetota bacterium]